MGTATLLYIMKVWRLYAADSPRTMPIKQISTIIMVFMIIMIIMIINSIIRIKREYLSKLNY